MKVCPNCKKEEFTIYGYCSNCGTELEQTWKYECLACGHMANKDNKFCVACGSPLFIATGDLSKDGS